MRVRLPGVLLAVMLAASGCGGGEGASGSGSGAAAQQDAPASASASAPQEAAHSLEDAKAAVREAVTKPAPPLTVAAPGPVEGDKRLFSQQEVPAVLEATRAAIDASQRNPALFSPDPKTPESFAALLALSTPPLQATLKPLIEAYVRSEVNGGTDTSLATKQEADNLLSLASVLAALTEEHAEARGNAVAGEFDPAGAFGPGALTDVRLMAGTRPDGAAMMTVLFKREMRMHTVDHGAPSSFVTRADGQLFFVRSGGRLLLDGWRTGSFTASNEPRA